MDDTSTNDDLLIDKACHEVGELIMNRIFDLTENNPHMRLELIWRISEMLVMVGMNESNAEGGPALLEKHIELYKTHLDELKDMISKSKLQ